MLFQLFSYTITFAYYAPSGETVQCTKIISTTELYCIIAFQRENTIFQRSLLLMIKSLQQREHFKGHHAGYNRHPLFRGRHKLWVVELPPTSTGSACVMVEGVSRG